MGYKLFLCTAKVYHTNRDKIGTNQLTFGLSKISCGDIGKNGLKPEKVNSLLEIEYFSNGKMAYFYFLSGKNNKALHQLLILKTNVTAI